ncbi:hypothetical protein IEO21_07035 [Rhodonia placenta]|uniref:Uncharacterized protein n=1 Tax=Rhodonia placenta TaxID=104341 RepID=A0A8H7NYS6_9APHY|nr:hypothetical protein IEO21_07035 [Postia placenta]
MPHSRSRARAPPTSAGSAAGLAGGGAGGLHAAPSRPTTTSAGAGAGRRAGRYTEDRQTGRRTGRTASIPPILYPPLTPSRPRTSDSRPRPPAATRLTPAMTTVTHDDRTPPLTARNRLQSPLCLAFHGCGLPGWVSGSAWLVPAAPLRLRHTTQDRVRADVCHAQAGSARIISGRAHPVMQRRCEPRACDSLCFPAGPRCSSKAVSARARTGPHAHASIARAAGHPPSLPTHIARAERGMSATRRPSAGRARMPVRRAPGDVCEPAVRGLGL